MLPLPVARTLPELTLSPVLLMDAPLLMSSEAVAGETPETVTVPAVHFVEPPDTVTVLAALWLMFTLPVVAVAPLRIETTAVLLINVRPGLIQLDPGICNGKAAAAGSERSGAIAR